MAIGAVSSSTIFTSVWDNIYSIVNDNKANLGATVQTITSAFPTKDVDNKASYPIIVIHPISFSQENFTMGKAVDEMTSIIGVYTTHAEDLDKIMSKLVYYLTQNKATLRNTAGTVLESMRSAGADTVIRSGMKVHNNNVVLTLKYRYAW